MVIEKNPPELLAKVSTGVITAINFGFLCFTTKFRYSHVGKVCSGDFFDETDEDESHAILLW